MSHIVVVGILAGLAVTVYLHRAYVKSLIVKVEAAHAATFTALRADIAKVIASAKADASKVEAKADAIVAKVEADIRKIL